MLSVTANFSVCSKGRIVLNQDIQDRICEGGFVFSEPQSLKFPKVSTILFQYQLNHAIKDYL